MIKARPIHDYSMTKDTVIRVVRPRNHIGHSYGGDRVKLDAAELAHPAMATALWTEEEERSATEEAERRRLAGLREEASPSMRAADVQLALAAKQRAERAEAERKAKPSEE